MSIQTTYLHNTYIWYNKNYIVHVGLFTFLHNYFHSAKIDSNPIVTLLRPSTFSSYSMHLYIMYNTYTATTTIQRIRFDELKKKEELFILNIKLYKNI